MTRGQPPVSAVERCTIEKVAKPFDLDRVKAAVRLLLISLGEDPEREGLVETPARVARFWCEFLSPPACDGTCFTTSYDEMIVVGGIRGYSMCEHHLLPFSFEAAVGYIPEGGRVVGLSKLVRAVELAAGSLQLQERLTAQVADSAAAIANTPDVAVIVRAEHLCMMMRGVKASHSVATTSVMRGAFFTKPSARAEFMALAQPR